MRRAMYISPKVDLIFKKLFGVEENKDLLISLINSIVSDEDKVADVTILNPYNSQSFVGQKLSILDIKAKGVDGKLFNIEIQITDSGDYDKRALYYWAKLYSEQLKAGDDYGSLQKAIGIHILNFFSIPESKKYHNAFHITEKESGLKYFSQLELHTIELSKFANSREDLTEIVKKVRTTLDIWVTFLSRHDLLKANNLPSTLDIPEVNKAMNILELMSLNAEERDVYEGHIKWIRDEASTLKRAEEKGIAKGREEGRAEGRAEGVEKVALAMLQKGLDTETVAELTGLTRTRLLALQKKK